MQRKGNEKGNEPSREKRKKYKDSTSIFENTILILESSVSSN